jgi:hypothetical protein
MRLARLWTRVTRLEQQASQLLWYDDVQTFLAEVVREAGSAAGLPPSLVEQMGSALQARLLELGHRFPKCVRDEHAITSLMTAVITAVQSVLARQVGDPKTRQQVERQIRQILQARADAERG